jgi:hypothetical protein
MLDSSLPAEQTPGTAEPGRDAEFPYSRRQQCCGNGFPCDGDHFVSIDHIDHIAGIPFPLVVAQYEVFYHPHEKSS